jgi:thymidylate kinase
VTVEWFTAYRTVILEGCDGVGKTTLAKTLAADHGYTALHNGRTSDEVDMSVLYLGLLETPGRLVLDRCFLSELVYEPLYRNSSRLTWNDALDLVAAVVARDGVFVHLAASVATIRGRLHVRDGVAPSVRDIEALCTAYEQLFTDLAAYAPVMRVDISGTGRAS